MATSLRKHSALLLLFYFSLFSFSIETRDGTEVGHVFSSLCPSFKDLTCSLPPISTSGSLCLCFSLCSQPSETDRACTTTITNQFTTKKTLTFTFQILSSLFPCVFHPSYVCKILSALLNPHDIPLTNNANAFQSLLRLPEVYFPVNVAERHKTCGVC